MRAGSHHLFRRPWLAWLAVFALWFQVQTGSLHFQIRAFPGKDAASPFGEVILCTSEGIKRIVPGNGDAPQPLHKPSGPGNLCPVCTAAPGLAMEAPAWPSLAVPDIPHLTISLSPAHERPQGVSLLAALGRGPPLQT